MVALENIAFTRLQGRVGAHFEWVGNLCVRTQAPDGRGEINAPNYLAEQVISLVKQQLEVDSEPEPEGKRILKVSGTSSLGNRKGSSGEVRGWNVETGAVASFAKDAGCGIRS